MAYRRSRGKAGKIQPAVHTISFSTTSVTSGNTGTFYIDLSQCASLVNRRFYRQGIQWAVGNIKLISGVTGAVQIGKLPSTWIMSNAWEKSFRAWQKMNNEALDEAPSAKPKFLDFKIFADAEHHNAGISANLLPVDYSGTTPYSTGEWVSSKIHVPVGVGAAAATEEFELVATGPSFPGAGASGHDAVSLIQGYASSRALPSVVDPNLPSDISDATGTDPENWMAALFSEGTTQTDDVLTDMFSSNNTAPYPYENDEQGNTDTMYPGGALQAPTLETHDRVVIFSNSGVAGEGVGIQNAKGGSFPCGLMRFDWTPGGTAGNLLIQIDLVPGSHRGYLCEPMTEM